MVELDLVAVGDDGDGPGGRRGGVGPAGGQVVGGEVTCSGVHRRLAASPDPERSTEWADRATARPSRSAYQTAGIRRRGVGARSPPSGYRAWTLRYDARPVIDARPKEGS